MLVLSRKKDQTIVIANHITVTVIELLQDKVRLGVVSPKDVPVYRQEVFDAIHGKIRLPSAVDPEEDESIGEEAADRLALSLTENSGSQVSRSMVIKAILEAVAAMEENLSQATSLEHLKQLLLRRRL
jgi:carbon storage regulator